MTCHQWEIPILKTIYDSLDAIKKYRPNTDFPFYYLRRQYPEREKKLKAIFKVAEFLEYQSKYFPMDSRVTPFVYYHKESFGWLNFLVPLCGNSKNKLLYRRLKDIAIDSNLYVEVVPVHLLWDRQTGVRIQLSRDLMDIFAVRGEIYTTTLEPFCIRMEHFLNYEEYETRYKTPTKSIRKRTYPPEEGREHG